LDKEYLDKGKHLCAGPLPLMYVTQATAHMGYTTPFMWEYINAGEKDSVKELFKAIISTTESETKRRLCRKQEDTY
jgi:hypothetical protein